MSRVFLCRSCQAQISRFHAAPAPERCIYCQSRDLTELVAPAQTASATGAGSPANCGELDDHPIAAAPSTSTASLEPFACERGEGCTRLKGGECPGGKGC